jgi:hypothetical protein
MKTNRWVDTGWIVLSIAISYIVSLTNPNLGNMEMDALANLYFPGMLGLPLLFIFLILSFIFKSFYTRFRWPMVILIAVINILFGLSLHFN